MYRPTHRATVCPHCDADTMADVGLSDVGFCNNCERQFSLWRAPEDHVRAWIDKGHLDPMSPNAPPRWRESRV